MGATLNIFALLLGLAALAGWTMYCCAVTRRLGWFRWLRGVGFLALFFSVVSPDDDAFQQELNRPTPPCRIVAAQTKIGRRGPVLHLSINSSAAAWGPIPAFRTGRLLVMDQLFDARTHFEGPTLIHSPPVAA